MPKEAPFNKNQTELECAYVAGIIDGEGCFYFGHVYQPNGIRTHHFHALISISSTDLILMEWLDKFTGRKHDGRYRWTSKKTFYRPAYRSTIGGKLLDHLLPKIYPFLVIKKEHAEIMFEIRKTFGKEAVLSNETVEHRLELLKKLRKLNTRFHEHPLKK